MKYLETFESFHLNELQDWSTISIDVNRGLPDLYSKIIIDLKIKLGSMFQTFLKHLNDCIKFLDYLPNHVCNSMLLACYKFFGKPTETLTVEEIKHKIEIIFPYSLRESINNLHNDSPTTPPEQSLPVTQNEQGGIIDDIASILQQIFSLNLLSWGTFGQFIAWLIGSTLSLGNSVLISLIGIIVMIIIRKLNNKIKNIK